MKQSFTLINPRIRGNAARAIADAPDGYRVTISAPSRSGDQNAMFHAICGDVAKAAHQFFGKARDQDDWKMLLISAHNIATTDDDNGFKREIVEGIEGELVVLRESSAQMRVGRMASLITYCLAYCDTNGIALTETRRGGFLDERDAV